jgi:hypothetical protein
MPELEAQTWSMDEPFDWMVLARSVYLTARRQNIRVMLDAAGSDVLFDPGTYLARLFRQGRWVKAWQEGRAWDTEFRNAPRLLGPLRSLPRRRRTRSAALYAAIPPLTPSSTRVCETSATRKVLSRIQRLAYRKAEVRPMTKARLHITLSA